MTHPLNQPSELPDGYRWGTPDEVEYWLAGNHRDDWQWVGPGGHQDLAVPIDGPEFLWPDKPQKRYKVELTETVSYQIYVDADFDATKEEVHQQAIDEHIDGLSTEVDNGPVEVESIVEVKARD